MACLQVKLCVAISERFRKCIWYLNALYKCPGYFTDKQHNRSTLLSTCH